MRTEWNEINIAIDADSLCYKACYRHQVPGGVDIEQAFMEFGYEIGKIKSAVFKLVKYEPGDKVVPIIVLSPKKTFRNELSSEYKSNRKEKEPIHGIKQLKLMIMHRVPQVSMVAPGIEADDIIIYLANNENMLISAIDKDVLHASPTSCYNYNQRRWENSSMTWEIEAWYVKQALMGDSGDNIKGAEDIGEVRAQTFINKYEGDMFSWSHFVDMFGDESLALLAMNLVRMDRVFKIDGKFVHNPWEPFDEDNIYWEQ